MEFDLLIESIRKSMKQINRDLDVLYADKNKNVHQVLEHLNREIMILDGKLQKYRKSNQLTAVESPVPATEGNQSEGNELNKTRLITLEELAINNGKDGNPAYVAINGLVYDVTNSPAWAAGTHFGLSAGNDLTKEFNACHVDKSFLASLPVVGFLY